MGKIRMSYKDLRKYISEYNENKPKEFPDVYVSAWGECYHICRNSNNEMIAIGSYPSECWNEFRQWKYGLYEGYNLRMKEELGEVPK